MQLTLAQRIRALRLHYRLSVQHFAQGCRVSHVTIFNLEKGAKLSIKMVLKICDTYGTTVEWLVEGRGAMLPDGDKELDFVDAGQKERWQGQAYDQLLLKNAALEQEIEKLWQALNQVITMRQQQAG